MYRKWKNSRTRLFSKSLCWGRKKPEITSAPSTSYRRVLEPLRKLFWVFGIWFASTSVKHLTLEPMSVFCWKSEQRTANKGSYYAYIWTIRNMRRACATGVRTFGGMPQGCERLGAWGPHIIQGMWSLFTYHVISIYVTNNEINSLFV